MITTLERLTDFDARVRKELNLPMENKAENHYKPYLQGSKAHKGLDRYEYSEKRNYICFYFADEKTKK